MAPLFVITLSIQAPFMLVTNMMEKTNPFVLSNGVKKKNSVFLERSPYMMHQICDILIVVFASPTDDHCHTVNFSWWQNIIFEMPIIITIKKAEMVWVGNEDKLYAGINDFNNI